MKSQLQARPERPDPAPRQLRAAWPPRRVTAVSALLLLLTGMAAALSLRPPPARPVSAPAAEFSADRAMAMLGGIASVPHPTGSPASAEVRAYLVNALRDLDLDPQVETRVAARTADSGRHTVGTVSNVHARIAGAAPTGRVLLLAHYDSVPTGPGASDNGANVAAILEIARALRTGPQPRNDIDLLFTDAEEHGLLGAQAFVDSGAAGDPRRVVAVNLEARGVSGPSVMFEMAGTGLVGALRAADPVTTSFAAAVYQVLPNDTDLTALGESGMRGLNFAFMDRSSHYHTPHDDIAHVSDRSVQDTGETVLAAVRYLGESDLSTGGSDATYFSLFGVVVSYPAWLVLPLAGVLLAGYVALLMFGGRRGLRLRGVVRAAAAFALVVPGAMVIGFGGWWVLTLLRPDFLLGFGGIHRPVPYALAEAALLLVALVAWYRWARRRASPEEVAVGVLGWLSLFAVLSAVFLPGAAYLFTWPALVGMAALAAALWWTGPESPIRILAGSAAGIAGMALMLPIALLLLPALGLALSAAWLLLAALVAASSAYVLEPLPRRRLLSAGMAVVVATSAATVGIGVTVDDYDTNRPRPVSLAYALETDAGTATWVSVGGPEQPHVGTLLTSGPVRLDDRVPPLGGWSLNSGPAPVAEGLALPEAEASTAVVRDGVRTIDLRLRVPADAYAVDVYADTTAHEILDATVEGAALHGGHHSTATGAWRWGFRYAAPPPDGIDVTLRARGPGPLRIRVVSTRAGLPSGVDAPVLSPDTSWSPWPLVPAQTFIVRTFRL
jgi:hypothetical protein